MSADNSHLPHPPYASDTPVLKIVNGQVISVPIGSLKVGDQLVGPDGTPRTVLELTRGIGPATPLPPMGTPAPTPFPLSELPAILKARAAATSTRPATADDNNSKPSQ